MCPNSFLLNKDVRKDELNFYKSVSRNPKFTRIALLIKKFRRNNISIRWNRKEKRISLLGKTYLMNK